MTEVSIRDLRNHGGEVIDRVEAGEHVTVTRAGKAVAELRPLGLRPINRAVLLQRWSRTPALDACRVRAETDQILDPST